jgi:hypothetical protein
MKDRKVLFATNDNKYPWLFLNDDGRFLLIKKDGTLTGDGYFGVEDALLHFPKADIMSVEQYPLEWECSQGTIHYIEETCHCEAHRESL